MNVPNDETPEQVGRNMYTPPSSGGSGKDRLINAVIAVAASILVYFLLSGVLFPTVSKNDFDKNITNIVTDIKTLQGSVGAIPDMQNKVKDATTQVAALQGQISKAQADATNANNTIQNLGSQYAKQSDLNSVRDSINNLVNNNKTITDLQSQVKALSDAKTAQDKSFSDLKTTVTDLQAQVKKLQANPTSTTTTTTGGTTTSGATGSTNTNGVITASLSTTSVSWDGNPLISLSPRTPLYGTIIGINVTTGGTGYTSAYVTISPPSSSGGVTATAQAICSGGSVTGITMTGYGSGYTSAPAVTISGNGTGATATVINFTAMQARSTSATFQLQMSNSGVSTTASNIQLAVGLYLVDGTGNPITDIPAWVSGDNIKITSNAMGVSWTYQSLISPNMLIYSNQNTTSSFYTSGLSLSPQQSTSLSLYVTATNNNPSATEVVYIYPMIKVLGFQSTVQ